MSNVILTNRRLFLRDAFTIGIGSFLLKKSFPNFSSLPEFDNYNANIGLRSPEKTGILNSKEHYVLWSYFKFIGQYWDTMKYSIISSNQDFTEILNLKTSKKPSYLEEYRSAVLLLSKKMKPDKQIDFEAFLFHNDDEYSKKFITLEFLNLTIASGGFKKFGYKNYTGFMGGSFNNPSNIPYRVS